MSARQDAVDLLKADQDDVNGLFEAYDALCERDASVIEKSALAEQICLELSVHSQVEQEVFYPAVRAVIGDDELMDEAQADHTGIDSLVAQVAEMPASDPPFDVRLAVLRKAVGRHVKDEQARMYPMLRKTNIDLMALGARLQDRKAELLVRYTKLLGRDAREDEDADPVGMLAATGRLG
jgi:Hemerythrin HHE cation binding domain